MRKDFYYESRCGGQLHGCRWNPEGTPVGVVQIVHGIAEFVERYDDFARFMCWLGYVVVAEDHMGHGGSISEEAPQGYFAGGWESAVEDTYQLLTDTRKEFPDMPYVLFGHSMGSFMVRTILEKYPDSSISAAVICGTGWMPGPVISAGKFLAGQVCRRIGERTPSEKLNNMIFGSYNKRVEHPRTSHDWLSRDKKVVDDYIAHPLCGFVPSAGLLRDMMGGISYIQRPENLNRMNRELPVYFIAGGDDPVGNYGSGVRQAAEAFKKHGMKQVSLRIWPLCRHEILNEINKEEIYEDVKDWIESVT